MLCASLRVIDNDCGLLTHGPQEVAGLFFFKVFFFILPKYLYIVQVSSVCLKSGTQDQGQSI